MNVALSGFGDTVFKKYLIHRDYVVKETTNNVELLIIKEDLDYIQFKSSKIKQALMNNVKIITYSDFLKKEKLIDIKNVFY
jgi:hypothetical protein